MRVLIVDDERPAREKMRRLLELEPDISAIDEARDGVDALERLPGFAPDLLLLDIQMPEITGLEVAASLPAPAPLVVFVTAYDEYAIRAFDANAIDYLLKPYDQQRLQRALQRVRTPRPAARCPDRPAHAANAHRRTRPAANASVARHQPVADPGTGRNPHRQGRTDPVDRNGRQLRRAAHGRRPAADAPDAGRPGRQTGPALPALPPPRRRAAGLDRQRAAPRQGRRRTGAAQRRPRALLAPIPCRSDVTPASAAGAYPCAGAAAVLLTCQSLTRPGDNHAQHPEDHPLPVVLGASRGSGRVL